MLTCKIIEGLTLLERYRDDVDVYSVGAEQDKICAYETSRPLSDRDVARMIELGWHQEHDGRDYNESMKVSDYRPDETWYAYT